MAKLEDIRAGSLDKGVADNSPVTAVTVSRNGAFALAFIYHTESGALDEAMPCALKNDHVVVSVTGGGG